MAEDNVNVNPAAAHDGDDTVTRKTIRLRPMPSSAKPQVPPATPAASAAPASPAVADGSGEDTKTRRTIKLKPIAGRPPVSAPMPPPAPAAPSPTPIASEPAAPAPAPVAPVPAAAAPVAAAGDGEDTVTRKTLVLKPINANKTTAPAAKPVVEAPASDNAVSDNTVKLQRPAPKPLTPPSAPASAPKPLTPPPVAASKPLTPPPASAPKPLTPPPAAVPKPQAITPPPPPAPAAPAAAPKGVDSYAQTGDSPSMLYLIVAAVSLICLIYSTLLITVQFLDLTQGQKVEEQIPAFILPKAK